MAAATYSGVIGKGSFGPYELPGSPCGGVDFSITFTTTVGSQPIGALGASVQIDFYSVGGTDCFHIELDSQNVPGSSGCGTFAGSINGKPMLDRAPTSGTTTISLAYPDADFVPGFTYTWTTSFQLSILWEESPYGCFGPLFIQKPDGSEVYWNTLDTGTGYPGTTIDPTPSDGLNPFGYFIISCDEAIVTTFKASATTAQHSQELLLLNPPEPTLGQPVVLTGVNLGGTIASAIDYYSSVTGTWTALSNFSSGAAFSGETADTAAYGTWFYKVRDHNNPSVVSNSVVYYLAPPTTPGAGSLTVAVPMPVYLECVPCGPILLVGPGNIPVSAGA